MGHKSVLSKIAAAIASIISIITFTSAQQDFFGEWGILQDGAELATAGLDYLFWFEINTIPQAAMFLAVFAGFYFLSLKFVMTVFDIIDERLDTGSGGSYSLSDTDTDASTIEKGMSAAIAFMVTQYMGMLGLLLWVVIPSIFLIIFFLTSTRDLFGAYNAGGPVTEVDQQVDQQLREVDEELETTQTQEDEIEEEQQHDEDHMGKDESVKETEQHIELELNQIHNVEEQFDQIEEQLGVVENEVETRLEQIAEKERKIIELEEQTTTQTNKIKDSFQKLKEYEKNFLKRDQFFEDKELTPEMIAGSSPNSVLNKDGIMDELAQWERKELEQIKEEVKNAKEVHVEIEATKSNIASLQKEVEKFYKELKELQSIETEEETIISKLKKYAQQKESQKLNELLEKDEEQLKRLESKFEEIFDKEQHIKEKLDHLKNQINKEKEKEKEIISRIDNIDQKLEVIENMIESFGEELERYKSEMNIDGANEEELNKIMRRMQEADTKNPDDVELDDVKEDLDDKIKQEKNAKIILIESLQGALGVSHTQKQVDSGWGGASMLDIIREARKEINNYEEQIK